MYEVYQTRLLDNGILIVPIKNWEAFAKQWEENNNNKITKYYVQKHPKGMLLLSYIIRKEA